MARRSRPRSFECPHCGASVRAGALACAECGADAETGWAEGAEVWGADLPAGHGRDEDFDYGEFLAREGLDGAGPLSRQRLRVLAWRALVIALALALLGWLALR